MPSRRTDLPAWKKLVEHERAVSGRSLRELFAEDAGRFDRFSLTAAGLFADWSKQRITAETIKLLGALARECKLEHAIAAMFAGERINATENRAALHVALRADRSVMLDGKDVTQEVKKTLTAMGRLARGVHSGTVKSGAGRPFTDVVNIGIGGSDLGPRLACAALEPYSMPRPRAHFVSNVDGAAMASALKTLDPRSTLFVVISKTFTTQETLMNARSAVAWLAKKLGRKGAGRNLCAVTSAPERAVEFGVAAERVFPMWDWVGGRYSLWSAVGLPIALATGMKTFDELLAGAREMDAHFRAAPLEHNLPVTLALLEVWNATFRGVPSRAVVPYDERLKLLPSYLQQLEMESCGKRVTRDGEAVSYPTTPLTWGSAGTDGQHAYFQWLHQGTEPVAADFIACRRAHHRLPGHHDALIANFLAQTEALAFGTAGAEAAKLPPYRVFEGNRPTTSIVLDSLTPRALGALIALYEHKVYAQSVIWDINAFDQWGVELGKHLAGRILPELGTSGPASGHDGSTNGLIGHFKQARRKK
jgi:glucose-6-phosphate isomerase